MNPALIPATMAGRQLAWLMSLRAAPSSREIQDHLDVPVGQSEDPRLASGLLRFGTLVRDVPGVVTESEELLLRLELEQDGNVQFAVVSVDAAGSGKIDTIDVRDRPSVGEVELDRIRLLYDRAAPLYEDFASQVEGYWERARAWLVSVASEGCTLLDVGCGPGNLVADLPESVRVIGCDLAPEMVRLAALARPTGLFAVHDYHEPFPADWPRADVTVALGCLEFASDLGVVLGNLGAATRGGGRLLVTVPRADGEHERKLPQLDITLRLRDDPEVEAAARSAGLEVTAHDVIRGFSAPGVGDVQYGLWELFRR